MKTLNHLIIMAFAVTTIIVAAAFAPLNQSGAIVTTVNVTNIKSTSAICSIKITGSPVSETGVCCWTAPNPVITNKKFALPAGNVTGGAPMMTGLAPGTKYYVRSYVISNKEVIYGNEKSFTTLPAQPGSTNTGQKVEQKPTTNR